MMSNAGPNPNKSIDQKPPPSSIGLALISTPFSIKRASNPGPTKDGSVVVKVLAVLDRSRDDAPGSLAGRDARPEVALCSPAGGYETGVLKRPVSISPWPKTA